MKPSERLIIRIRKAGLDLPIGTTLERIYAGEGDRLAGSYFWFALGPDGDYLNVIGTYTMADCLRATSLEIVRPKQITHDDFETEVRPIF